MNASIRIDRSHHDFTEIRLSLEAELALGL